MDMYERLIKLRKKRVELEYALRFEEANKVFLEEMELKRKYKI